MPLSRDELRNIIAHLASRPGHEQVRSDVKELLVYHLGAERSDILFEQSLAEVRGRLDALIGRTVFEFKSDLRRERKDAETQLAAYLGDRQRVAGERYVGIATDGAEFIPYELRHSKLIAFSPFKVLRGDADGLPRWLRSFIALVPEKRPDPEIVRKELGRESLVYEIARSRIAGLWDVVREQEDVRLKRQLWADRLSLVYGTSVDDDNLFFQHTYLTTVAKAMATSVLGVRLPDAPDLLSGRPFEDAGIEGVVESDFFDWVLQAPGSSDLIREIAGQIATLRLGDIEHDVLKGLYESLIDPEQRHDLGEYYTPDWLADWMCERVIDKPLEMRVLDPACGSGTFLFHAVRRFLDAADETRMADAEALTRCTQLVMGIDVHPVAVINARITYLLALGEARLRRPGRPKLAIPVYLGDSLQWNATEIVGEQEMQIEVPGEKPLVFPVRVARTPSLFDGVLAEMLRLAESDAPKEMMTTWIEAGGRKELVENKRVLSNTYERLWRLYKAKHNHIWGYIARNLSRPVWLSSGGEGANVLIGNPLWLSYRYMSKELQGRFRKECEMLDMWAGGKVATHQDLSAYFFARTMDLYLRSGGKIAYVMPYATMSRKQYRGFITREARDPKGNLLKVPVRRFTDAWILDEVQPLFNVPSCVLFAEEGSTDGFKLPAKAVAFSGELSERDASARAAARSLSKREVAWPETPEEMQSSAYGGHFLNGATVVPRMLFIVTRREVGRFGANPAEPAVESRRTAQEKPPWKHLPSLKGRVEKQFLRPLYLGESIAPYRLLEPVEAVIPWDSRDGLLDSPKAHSRGYTNLADWLREAEKLWDTHGPGRFSLSEQLDYYGKLAAQFPPPNIRVLYAASGTLPAAAILTDESGVIEHGLYWAAESMYEAQYLIALLNSEALRAKIAAQQSRGQWGPRHFDKLLANAIPQFDGANPIHRDLVEAAERAEKVASETEIPKAHFTRVRQVIRAALQKDGIWEKIERLAAQAFS
ncbi:MAG: N-6 DNA methylase [Deltaproteobacteria bacterium]|nr:N-6 DNA methylase [Deltaproteobacteria bacterium]